MIFRLLQVLREKGGGEWQGWIKCFTFLLTPLLEHAHSSFLRPTCYEVTSVWKEYVKHSSQRVGLPVMWPSESEFPLTVVAVVMVGWSE